MLFAKPRNEYGRFDRIPEKADSPGTPDKVRHHTELIRAGFAGNRAGTSGGLLCYAAAGMGTGTGTVCLIRPLVATELGGLAQAPRVELQPSSQFSLADLVLLLRFIGYTRCFIFYAVNIWPDSAAPQNEEHVMP